MQRVVLVLSIGLAASHCCISIFAIIFMTNGATSGSFTYTIQPAGLAVTSSNAALIFVLLASALPGHLGLSPPTLRSPALFVPSSSAGATAVVLARTDYPGLYPSCEHQ